MRNAYRKNHYLNRLSKASSACFHVFRQQMRCVKLWSLHAFMLFISSRSPGKSIAHQKQLSQSMSCCAVKKKTPVTSYFAALLQFQTICSAPSQLDDINFTQTKCSLTGGNPITSRRRERPYDTGDSTPYFLTIKLFPYHRILCWRITFRLP